jgi:hypothetical protein
VTGREREETGKERKVEMGEKSRDVREEGVGGQSVHIHSFIQLVFIKCLCKQ